MEEKQRYQPYVPANEDGNNELKENRGSGSTQPFIPNGWGDPNWEGNTFQEDK